ncbi:hypothetical protein RG47T_4227 [Mucilaginibacter polytrichastri]|uniref:Thioredoxin domain-containing protein n=1 Tax=Mucilaginibacter polytrichastri TaxID=1302689 RepID=A0A1Q6A409_9SPHI|nr:hypothetical protein RG47T_4227 [Mucilaginibacter polytrichastri]
MHAQTLQFTIKGKLQNISPMPSKVYLKEAIPMGLLSKPTDSAEVKNGAYHFSGQLTVDEPVMVFITSGHNVMAEDKITVVLDKGELAITSDGTLDNLKVTGSGSLANHQYDDMKGSTKKTADSIKMVKITEAYKADKALQKKINGQAFSNSITGIVNMYKYIKVNPQNRISPYGTYILVALPLIKQEGKDTLISLLPEKVKADKLGLEIVRLNNKTKVTIDSAIKAAQAKTLDGQSKVPLGSQAADITQNDPAGKPVSLASLKGKYVLVDFWASWCAPCRAENPNVVKLFKQYQGKGFTVFGVSLDAESSRAAWIKAIATDALAWTQVSDLKGWANAAAKTYDVKSIPQNFLLDPNGVIIAKNLRGDDLAKKLASLFGK